MNYLDRIKTLEDIEVSGKTVFLRLDLNVPINNGKVLDTNRIDASIPTIKYLLDKGAKLIIASHLGRPKSDKDTEFSLEPVAKVLSEKIKKEVVLVDQPKSDALTVLLKTLKSDQVLLLENLRFNPGEEKNDVDLAMFWAKKCDIYVNDAFGACHRAHASIDALPKLVTQKAAGFLVFNEFKNLSSIMSDTVDRPFTMIMGGAKVSDKIAVIENFINKVDSIIIGGAMAYTFLKAMGISVGKSKVENDKVKFAAELLERFEAREKKIYLPVDHVVADGFEAITQEITKSQNIPEGKMALDIGPKTIELFFSVIKKSKTVFWNGPMGVYEKSPYDKGTIELAKILANSNCKTIVGGGDSAAAAAASGVADKFFHISTGGGASLEFLEGKKLPGIAALEESRRV